jgi:hypothetical protein
MSLQLNPPELKQPLPTLWETARDVFELSDAEGVTATVFGDGPSLLMAGAEGGGGAATIAGEANGAGLGCIMAGCVTCPPEPNFAR